MPDAASQYNAEEFTRHGEELFEREICAKVVDEDPENYLLIDTQSGDYETDANELAAFERLNARRPDAMIYFRKVGSRITRRFGVAREHEDRR